MRYSRRRAQARLAGFALLAFTASAFADCTLEATGLHFDHYDASNTQDAVGTGYISVKCDSGVQYTLTLSTGGSNSYSARALVRAEGGQLTYNLFQSQTQNPTLAWGDGTTAYQGIGNGTWQSIPVYGRIPAGQIRAAVGTYTDTITVILTTPSP